MPAALPPVPERAPERQVPEASRQLARAAAPPEAAPERRVLLRLEQESALPQQESRAEPAPARPHWAGTHPAGLRSAGLRPGLRRPTALAAWPTGRPSAGSTSAACPTGSADPACDSAVLRSRGECCRGFPWSPPGYRRSPCCRPFRPCRHPCWPCPRQTPGADCPWRRPWMAPTRRHCAGSHPTAWRQRCPRPDCGCRASSGSAPAPGTAPRAASAPASAVRWECAGPGRSSAG